MMSISDAALKIGLPVFACAIDKRPCVQGGFKSATTDKTEITRQFSLPGAKMIGLPTGQTTNTVVIDVDIKNGALGMDWLNENQYALPETRTIKTKSGGLHLYFKYPMGFDIRGSASRIAPGVDVRANGNYVIIPPSPGYVIADSTNPTDMPSWLISACLPKEHVPKPQQYSHDPLTEGGTKYGLAALDAECQAVRNAGWGSQEVTLNGAALKVGALVAGGQLEESPSREALIRAGNCMASAPGETPWTPKDIGDKVRRGMSDGMRSPRRPPQLPRREYSSSDHVYDNEPGKEYDAEQEVEPKDKLPPSPLLWMIDEEWAEDEIPHRPWIVKGFILRGSLTVISGPGSAGKSSLMVAWATSLALGMDYGRFKPQTPFRVLSYNVEDDRHEQMRRISATCRQFSRTPRDLIQNMRMVGPTEMGTLLTLSPNGGLLVNTPVMQELEEFIDQWKPDVVILDPFVELHSSEENDNTAIRQVLAKFRSWAIRQNIGLILLHHSRKGAASPGDPDSMRGASAIVGAARVALTLNAMTEDEAKDMGINIDNRRDFFRLDGAKMNYAKVQDADWFERQEYQLDNEEGVAAAIPWNPPKQSVGLSHVAKIIPLIERGTDTGPYSPKLSKEPRSIRIAMEEIGVTLWSAQKELLEMILKDPEITTCAFKSRLDRVKRQGLKTPNGPKADWQEDA